MKSCSQVCSEYIVKPFISTGEDVPLAITRPVAVVILAILTFINSVSVKRAIQVQDLFTLLKLAAIGLVTAVGVAYIAKDAAASGTPAHDNFRGSFRHSSAFVWGKKKEEKKTVVFNMATSHLFT